MDGTSANTFTELHEGMLALLTRIERVEEETSLDLSSLRLDVEALLSRIERNGRGRRARESAVVTFDQLLKLDSGFSALASRWAEARRASGLAAATEVVEQANVRDGWHERWGDSFEYAWRYRVSTEERDARAEARGRPRAGADPLPLVLALDLRYATDLPLARIAEYFNLSASAVQARVANFEGRVAEEIVRDTIQRQLPPKWQLVLRHLASSGDFELRPEDARADEGAIDVQVIPAWPDRDSGAGRPREIAAPLSSRALGRGRQFVWAVVFFEGPRVYFIPEARVRAHAEGAKILHARLDMLIQLASSLGFEDLRDAIAHATRSVSAGS